MYAPAARCDIQRRHRRSAGSSSQAPYSSFRRKRQNSCIPLLVLSKLQPLHWVAIWFQPLLREKIWKKRPLERFYCAVAPEPLTFGLFTWLVSLPQPIETAKQKRAKPENLRMDSRQILFDFCIHKYLTQRNFRQQKFCRPPEGRLDYGLCNENTYNAATCLSGA